MRKICGYIFVFAIAALSMAGCSLYEADIDNSTGRYVTVIGSVPDFNEVNVGTKATGEDPEKDVKEITMAIFDSNKAVVGRVVNVEVSGTTPAFIIDTKHTDLNGNLQPMILVGSETIYIQNSQAALKDCNIYMLANCWHNLPKDAEGKCTITNEDDLLNMDIPVADIRIPDTGMPMFGQAEETDADKIDLSADRQGSTQMKNITMFKLLSKITVAIQLNANNVIATPKFQITGWQAFNIPSKVRLGKPAEGAATPGFSPIATSSTTETLNGVRSIYHSASLDNPPKIQFSFYMPEHRVNPDKNITYPTGITDNEKQRYKPLLCSNALSPAYVHFEGYYTDHQDEVYEVRYNLYLGQDNTKDFYINRNQHLNNKVIIRGASKEKDDTPDDTTDDNISVDHRVEIESEGNYAVKVERDALLDSHFEVRPMDIYITGAGRVVVTVVDESSTDATDGNRIWLRMEKGGKTGDDYIGSTGVRKYFTTNLVTTTLAAGGKSIEVAGSDSDVQHRIWLYFDENPNVFDRTIESTDANYDKYKEQYRDITVRLEYYNSQGVLQSDQTRNITFRQMNLWRLWSYTDDTKTTKARYYDIEYHEEYLNNYASDQAFGATSDGMEWGLNGTQLSEYYKAMEYDGGLSNFILSLFGADFNPLYDFYLTDDIVGKNGLTAHPYSGKNFTLKIGHKSGEASSMSNLWLNGSPSSVVQYCLHKNKRSSDGNIVINRQQANNQTAPVYSSNDVNWYLPSIDEIEDIVVAGYQDFEVFQNKFYWSSQPAYTIYGFNARDDDEDTQLYMDNTYYARATKVELVGSDWVAAKSDDTVPIEEYAEKSFIITWVEKQNMYADMEEARKLKEAGQGAGYQSRSTKNRIRCVRASGTAGSIGQ